MRASILLAALLLATAAVALPASALGSVHKCVITIEGIVCIDFTGQLPDNDTLLAAVQAGDIQPAANCTTDLPPSGCVVGLVVGGVDVIDLHITIR